jgi:collagenase-like PrtC family protease
VCLNYVQGASCYATSGRCLLGSRGALASNYHGECELHGKFDVWVTHENDLLITDLGFPSEEPKQCLALGVSESLARSIADGKPKQFARSVLTSQRICVKCVRRYWVSDHKPSSGLLKLRHGSFCPDCLPENSGQALEKELGALGYWCG